MIKTDTGTAATDNPSSSLNHVPHTYTHPLCQYSHLRLPTGSHTTTTRTPALPRGDPNDPFVTAQLSNEHRNNANTLTHTTLLSHAGINWSVTTFTENYASLHAPMNPDSIGNNTTGRKGTTCVPQNASSDTTSPHNTSLP